MTSGPIKGSFSAYFLDFASFGYKLILLLLWTETTPHSSPSRGLQLQQDKEQEQEKVGEKIKAIKRKENRGNLRPS